MAFILKTCSLQKKALKLYSPISNGNKIRSFCFRKFSLKNNADVKFQKLASAFGYGVGITVFFGFSNFHVWQEHKVNIIPAVSSYNFGYCEASIPSDDKKQPQSPRNNFNFLADIVEKTQNSVVYIEINARHPFTGEHIPISNGSGFIVKEDGLILTNAHVVNHFGQVSVKLYDGTTFYGVVENLDTESDLATVRIKAKNLPALPLGCSADIRPGEFVIAMGNPLTLSHTITAGVVSSANRKGKELGLHKMCDYIQTDATIHIGNSGGPLVNLDGEAIGINTMKVTEGISFAIPSDRAIEFLKKSENSTSGSWKFFKKSSGPGKHKFLGLTLFTLSPPVIKELKEHNADFPSVNHGVLVWRVMIHSPSYEAGIRPGDVITKVNQKEVLSADMIMALMEDGDTFQLTVHRGPKTFKCTVSLVEPVMP